MKPQIRALLVDGFTEQQMKHLLLATIAPLLGCGWFLYQVLNTPSKDSAWLPAVVVAVALLMILVTAIVLRCLMQGVPRMNARKPTCEHEVLGSAEVADPGCAGRPSRRSRP